MKLFTKLAMATLLTFSSISMASNGGGNGGHPYAAEFQNIMSTIYYEMDTCGLWGIQSIKDIVYPRKLSQDMKVTRIEIKNRGRLIDKFGAEVSALNFPRKRKIKVLKKDWESLAGSIKDKRYLVLHEYLGIHDEAEVDHYRTSSIMLDAIEKCRINTDLLKDVTQATNGIAGGIVSIATNKRTKSSIIYARDNETLNFYIAEQGETKLLKSISVKTTATEIELSTTRAYRFRFLNAMKNGSANAYNWCWTESLNGNDQRQVGDINIAAMPATLGIILTPVTAPLCAILPGTPFLVGLLVAPIEAIGSTVKSLIGPEAIASRKFNKLVRGKYIKVSDKAFNLMIKKITEL